MEKITCLETSTSNGLNTNLEKVFLVLLSRCKEKNLKQEDLPDIIILFTDNEFDCQVYGDNNLTSYQNIKNEFTKYGYKIPIFIFWNLRGDANSIPVTKDETGTVLLSGFNPSMINCLIAGEIPTPYNTMLKAINNERYNQLKVCD